MRLARIVAAVVVAPLVLGGLLEIGLRVEGAVRSRPTDRPPPGTTVVLCVGDSHTRGLPDPDNYPVQLQRLLDERARGRYRVVNLGVPGLTTAQLRARLAHWLAYYRPSTTIFWGGLDNGWRQDETPWRPRPIARLGSRSRAVQFLRLVAFTGGLRFPRLETAGFEAADWRGVHAVWRVEFAGERDQIDTVPLDALPPDEVEAMTRADLRAIVESTRDAGSRAYAITYAFPGGYFRNANSGTLRRRRARLPDRRHRCGGRTPARGGARRDALRRDGASARDPLPRRRRRRLCDARRGRRRRRRTLSAFASWTRLPSQWAAMCRSRSRGRPAG
jgi:hypothetical protein